MPHHKQMRIAPLFKLEYRFNDRGYCSQPRITTVDELNDRAKLERDQIKGNVVHVEISDSGVSLAQHSSQHRGVE